MAGSELDLVVDALAGVLRDFGRHAFDLSRHDSRKTQLAFDQWAQHVLLGTEAPGIPGPVAALPQRHFSELRAFFQAHRRDEQAEVTASQDALREIVWSFVASLARVTQDDRRDDATVAQALGRLAEAVEHPSPQDIRRLTLDVVRQVNAAVEARRQRQERQLSELSERLESLGSQLEVARRESTTDPLTHLFNRRAFDEQLPRASHVAMMRGGEATLLVVDLDHFKHVNDTWGHPAGDALLRAVAQACVRSFKRKQDFVARYGGEEFVVLLADLAGAEAQPHAERLCTAIAALSVPWNDTTLRATVSVGLAGWRTNESPEAWLARADAALYRAKALGRNRVEVD